VSETYWAVTVEPWYSGSVPDGRTYRLYFGASHEGPVEGMFSFFPASTRNRHPRGFARPHIRLPGLITANLTQGKRLNPQRGISDVRAIWEEIAEQVRAAGLALGTRAELPRARPTVQLSKEGVRVEDGCTPRVVAGDEADQQKRRSRC
jgi:hypothetical protein